jgi:hypothetical protein
MIRENSYKYENDGLFKQKILPKIILVICVAIILTTIIYYIFPVGSHWAEIFRPASLRLLRGGNPYVGLNFFNPPWALLPLLPMAVLPERLGNAFLGSITIISFGYIAIKMGAKPITLALFLTLPLTLYNVIQVNIDWLVAWGFLLPPQIGLFFILLKPQMGVFLAFYWFIDCWKTGGIKLVIKVFSPVAVSFLLSFIFYGNYFQKGTVIFEGQYNTTLWPTSISIGLVILFLAFRLKKPGLAISSAPLLSPYVQPYSIPLAIFGLLPDQPITIILIIGLWFVFLDPGHLYVLQQLVGTFIK